MTDRAAYLVAALAGLRAEAEQRIHSAPDGDALQRLKTDYLGRKAGRVTAILRELPALESEARRQVGQAANETKAALEEALAAAEAALAARAPAQAEDLTMPARGVWRGALHPVTLVTDEICGIFRELGFTRAVGPEAETERNNFTALNFPPDHPALDAQDSFYLGPAAVLRTHTSPVQIRVMEAYRPPIRVVIPGRCFRRDPYDASHSPVFHQVEGLVVDEGITFVDLKAVITFFARRFLAPSVKVRFRPSFFPFTEPSAEVDVECQQCGGAGCSVCKGSGWMELLGCGMVDPAVFEAVGVDPERYTGWAFGMGLDRAAMVRYGLGDIRLLFEGDMRFHSQFVDAS